MSDENTKGTLRLIHGSMFSGKTEHMIAELRREQSRGRTVRAFKHSIDDRYDADHLTTHRRDRFEAVRVGSAEEIPALCAGAHLVAIEEGHFFGPALIPVVRQLRERGMTVLVAGITNDAWGRPFDPIPQLREMADEEVLLQAPCRVCGRPAPYTQRMVAVDSAVMVGGIDEYEPRCAAHFTPLSSPPEKR